MKELAAVLEQIGARNVRTYLQSGNAVVQSSAKNLSKLSQRIRAEIKSRRGFEPQVIILGVDEIERAIAQNPFPEADANPSRVHLGFLATSPQDPDLRRLDGLKEPTERFHLTDSVFYLHAPKGIGRSKLAAGAEKILGVTMTLRNWRTVSKIRDIASE